MTLDCATVTKEQVDVIPAFVRIWPVGDAGHTWNPKIALTSLSQPVATLNTCHLFVPLLNHCADTVRHNTWLYHHIIDNS